MTAQREPTAEELEAAAAAADRRALYVFLVRTAVIGAIVIAGAADLGLAFRLFKIAAGLE